VLFQIFTENYFPSTTKILRQKYKRLKMTLIKIIILSTFILITLNCSSNSVQTGLDNINSYQKLFKNKRVGIISNRTSYNGKDKYIVDILIKMDNVSVTALFGPEHGIFGNEEAGKKIDSREDSLNQIPVYSLYGDNLKPTEKMLRNVDILVFDIQDIGARFYTYISTMALAMEAAAEQGKTFVVLDRPNPINGVSVEGNILEPNFATFVGLYPIPARHGITAGELALMINEQGWLQNGVKAELKVIKLTGWKRNQWYDETNLTFRKPSPNIPNLKTAAVYPGLCLIEGINVSEGRGTTAPFMQFGAPWIDREQLTQELNELNLPGVQFIPHSFTPRSIAGMSVQPKFEGRICSGAAVNVIDRNIYQPYWTGVQIVNTIYKLYSDSLKWNVYHFDRLCGTSVVRQAIISQASLEELKANGQPGLKEFLKIRKKYLLYD